VIHLDTRFLVDLQREASGRSGPAHAFLEQRLAEPLTVSVHAVCELEAGIQLARNPERERARLQILIDGMSIAYPDERFVHTYARTYVALERRGKRMPAMDLLIAVAALIDRAALVTRNPRDFGAVPDLDVLGY